MFIFSSALATAQTSFFVANGAQVYVFQEDTVSVWGNFQNHGQVSSESKAVLLIYGDSLIQSNTASVSGNGKVVLQQPRPTPYSGNSIQYVNGGFHWQSSSGSTIANLVINNGNGVRLANTDLKVQDTFDFQNGRIELDTNNLTLGDGDPGVLLGYDETRFFVTTASATITTGGFFQREELSASTAEVDFPVGASSGNYTPARIQNDGTSDDISVRAFANTYLDGFSGADFNDTTIGTTWEIQEATTGGSDVTLSLQHNTTNEGDTFSAYRTAHFITHYEGTVGNSGTNGSDTVSDLKWDLLTMAKRYGGESGNGYITTGSAISNALVTKRSGINDFSPFTKRTGPINEAVCLMAKVLLQGALVNSATSVMTDDLRSNSIIPTGEPYAGLSGFSHVLNGGGETTTSTVLSGTGNNAIVDWVFLELRDTFNNTIVEATQSALLQRDGDVVDVDGTSPVCFSGLPSDSVYVAIRHRNHLGVMASSPVKLTPSGASLDFSTTTLFGSNATTTVNSVSALWVGNTVVDGEIKLAGTNQDIGAIRDTVLNHPGNLFQLNTFGFTSYEQEDLNMDATVRFSGSGQDTLYMRDNVINHPSNVFNQSTYSIGERLPK
ncbi:MAG: hypothetical protein JJ975_02095 [Bacteroidia bacterium]|nr:hypothetical protein [Bacteroidia bacterium]